MTMRTKRKFFLATFNLNVKTTPEIDRPLGWTINFRRNDFNCINELQLKTVFFIQIFATAGWTSEIELLRSTCCCVAATYSCNS